MIPDNSALYRAISLKYNVSNEAITQDYHRQANSEIVTVEGEMTDTPAPAPPSGGTKRSNVLRRGCNRMFSCFRAGLRYATSSVLGAVFNVIIGRERYPTTGSGTTTTGSGTRTSVTRKPVSLPKVDTDCVFTSNKDISRMIRTVILDIRKTRREEMERSQPRISRHLQKFDDHYTIRQRDVLFTGPGFPEKRVFH